MHMPYCISPPFQLKNDTLTSNQVALIKKSNNNQWNNKNPRGTATCTSYQKSVPVEVFAKYERARAAHNHAMENAPFFIGAVIVGNYAGLSSCTSLYFSAWSSTCFDEKIDKLNRLSDNEYSDGSVPHFKNCAQFTYVPLWF